MKHDLTGLLSKKFNEFLIDEDCALVELDRGGDKILFSDPIHVNGTLTLLEDEVVYFSGWLSAVAETVCGRCLSPVQELVNIEFGEIVYADGKEEDYDLIAEPEGEIFDMEEFLENLLVLKLPMKFLCDENCKGLCPICGTNLNTSECDCEEHQIDERFAKLKDLLKE